jgi:Uncharacterized conserved protein
MGKIQYLFICALAMVLLSCNTENRKLRILTCGIRHESNTFSTLMTTEADFRVSRGFDALKGQQWAEVCEKENIELIPTVHAYAWPGGVVEKSIFDKYKNEILESVKTAGKLDGIYLDMHGALHVDGYDDAQATFIKEIRDIVGDKVLIGGSFDLHGNLSPDFVRHINILTAYRTAPHRDGAETKARAVTLLIDAIRKGLKPHIESVTIPILVPGEKSITEVEPLHSIYARIPEIAQKEGMMDASVFVGYAWADLPRSAMRVFVVADDKKYSGEAKVEASILAQQIWDSREDMQLDVPSGSIDEMIQKAATYKDSTVFISDSGDNTTAGAPGDNPQVLEALLRNKISNAIVAGIVDPDVLQQCIDIGVGGNIKTKIGGKTDYVFGKPLEIEGKILFLSPGTIMDTPRGAAVIDVQGVKLVVLKSRRSFVEVRDFKEVNLDPLKHKIVVVKLGYLYPELRDIAPVHLMAMTSGFCNLDMKTLPFKNVHRPSYPLNEDMTWSISATIEKHTVR